MADDELDGVIAAPDHHRVTFENDLGRVLETTNGVGEITPLHIHLALAVMYMTSGSHDHRGRQCRPR